VVNPLQATLAEAVVMPLLSTMPTPLLPMKATALCRFHRRLSFSPPSWTRSRGMARAPGPLVALASLMVVVIVVVLMLLVLMLLMLGLLAPMPRLDLGWTCGQCAATS
jgi:hypothetical protein